MIPVYDFGDSARDEENPIGAPIYILGKLLAFQLARSQPSATSSTMAMQKHSILALIDMAAGEA